MTKFTVRSRGELIGYVPHMLGYPPTDSLVVVTASRKDGRSVIDVCVRCDFDPGIAARFAPSDAQALVRTLLSAHRFDEAHLLLFTDTWVTDAVREDAGVRGDRDRRGVRGDQGPLGDRSTAGDAADPRATPGPGDGPSTPWARDSTAEAARAESGRDDECAPAATGVPDAVDLGLADSGLAPQVRRLPGRSEHAARGERTGPHGATTDPCSDSTRPCSDRSVPHSEIAGPDRAAVGSSPQCAGAVFASPIALISQVLEDSGVSVSQAVWVGRGRSGPIPTPQGHGCSCRGGCDGEKHPPERDDTAFCGHQRHDVEDLEPLNPAVSRALDLQGAVASRDLAHAAALPQPSPLHLRVIDAQRATAHSFSELIGAIMSDVVDVHDHRRARVPRPLAVLGFEALRGRLWVRDLVQMMLGFDHPQLSPDILRTMNGQALLRRFGDRPDRLELAGEMSGLSARRPEPLLADAAVKYMVGMCSYVEVEALPTVLAMTAWLEWTRARHSFAQHYATAALDLDAHCTLAALVLQAATRGLPPAWLNSGNVV